MFPKGIYQLSFKVNFILDQVSQSKLGTELGWVCPPLRNLQQEICCGWGGEKTRLGLVLQEGTFRGLRVTEQPKLQVPIQPRPFELLFCTNYIQCT